MSQPAEKELSQFQEPLNLYEKVIPGALGVSNNDFFSRSNKTYKKYFEAWIASLFSRGFSGLVKPCEVRVCVNKGKEAFPDFEIRVDGHVHEFELTEVQLPKRKRGDEYIKGIGPRGKFAGLEETARYICDGVKKKANMNYNPSPHLLVYVNFQVAKEVDLKRVREVCRPYYSKFKSIWLLWAVSIAQLFASNDFGQVCEEWSEIPGYREECGKWMGVLEVSKEYG